MRQMTLTQSGEPGRVIGLTNFSHLHSMHGFRRNVQFFHWILSAIYFIFLILVGIELLLCMVVIVVTLY